MFSTEQEMSQKFEKFIKVNFGNSYVKEYQGLFGVPDFVYFVKNEKEILIVSFELKLKDWKRAAVQAFRYKSFSDLAYVVIPQKKADTVIENIELFKKYNIGLASFDVNDDFEILYKPEPTPPYSETLNKKVIEKVRTSRKRAKNSEVFMS